MTKGFQRKTPCVQASLTKARCMQRIVRNSQVFVLSPHFRKEIYHLMRCPTTSLSMTFSHELKHFQVKFPLTQRKGKALTIRNLLLTVVSMARPPLSPATHWKQNIKVGNGHSEELPPPDRCFKVQQNPPLTWWILQSIWVAMTMKLRVQLHEEIKRR